MNGQASWTSRPRASFWMKLGGGRGRGLGDAALLATSLTELSAIARGQGQKASALALAGEAHAVALAEGDWSRARIPPSSPDAFVLRLVERRRCIAPGGTSLGFRGAPEMCSSPIISISWPDSRTSENDIPM